MKRLRGPDAEFCERATAALARSMRIIRTPAHAAWLFSPHAPALPGASFASALVVRVSHEFTHTALREGVRSTDAPRVEAAALDLALAPARRVDGALVGAVAVCGRVVSDGILPFASALSDGVVHGRFMFDPLRSHLLAVLDNLAPHVIGVISARWVGDHLRERLFFVIPRKSYSFGDLPKCPIVALSNFETRISSRQQACDSLGAASSSILVDDLVNSLPTPDVPRPGIHSASTSPTTSAAPSCSSIPAPPSAHPPATTDTFDMSAMSRAVTDLEACLEGLFYGPNVKRDVLDPDTGELSERSSGELIANLSPASEDARLNVRQAMARDYFARAFGEHFDWGLPITPASMAPPLNSYSALLASPSTNRTPSSPFFAGSAIFGDSSLSTGIPLSSSAVSLPQFNFALGAANRDQFLPPCSGSFQTSYGKQQIHQQQFHQQQLHQQQLHQQQLEHIQQQQQQQQQSIATTLGLALQSVSPAPVPSSSGLALHPPSATSAGTETPPMRTVEMGAPVYDQADMHVDMHAEMHAEMHADALLAEIQLAPRPADDGSGDSRRDREADAASKEGLRQMRREAKRRRNRMSAARSNERRKQRERAQKNELETLRVRKRDLEFMERQLVEENERLRRQAQSLPNW